MRLQPSLVLNNGLIDEQARSLLCDSSDVLTSLPGDTYTLQYLLPYDARPYELFPESCGYYLEWMRQEWLEEENPEQLAQLLFFTPTALRQLAPEFKKVEAEMEDIFCELNILGLLS
ncbi:MAG: hypothetical protein ACE5G1_13180 [bacterium]